MAVVSDEFPPLCCPIDAARLEPQAGVLVCTRGHEFPITKGIPRLVSTRGDYTAGFGEQWTRYRVTQLDSYTGLPISRERLHRCIGDALWARLGRSPAVDVLETGCGAGRFTEVLLTLCGVRLTSTDLSCAVDANQLNCRQDERHRVAQCDIFSPPFAPGSFDVVLCLGVIQHTPDPEGAIRALYAQVKPGGWLVFDHYAPSVAQYTKATALLLRPLLKRLSPRHGTMATEILTRWIFPLHRAARHHPRLQMVLSRVSPLLTYFHLYPQLDDRLQWEWALLDTHDSLTDYYKHLRSVRQIDATLTSLGAVDISVTRGGNGVEARCRKPVGD